MNKPFGTNLTCAQCSKEYSRTESEIKSGQGPCWYCSFECRDVAHEREQEINQTIDDVMNNTNDIGQALLILRDKLPPEAFAEFKANWRHQPRHRDAAKVLRRLHNAFNQLRRSGYLARGGNWICCSTCGHHELGKQSTNGKWVFWHAQSHDNLIEDAQVHLQWSGDGEEICTALRETGLSVEWNGTEQRAIGVSLRLN